MDNNSDIKRIDQIHLLETVKIFTDTGEWKGIFTYPGCGYDLVLQGLATEDRKITMSGRAVLFLLNKGPDPTQSKAVETFELEVKKE